MINNRCNSTIPSFSCNHPNRTLLMFSCCFAAPLFCRCDPSPFLHLFIFLCITHCVFCHLAISDQSACLCAIMCRLSAVLGVLLSPRARRAFFNYGFTQPCPQQGLKLSCGLNKACILLNSSIFLFLK